MTTLQFPDPLVTNPYVAPNGTTYNHDGVKWVAVSSNLDPVADETITGKWDFSTGLTANDVTFGTIELIEGNPSPTIKTSSIIHPTNSDEAQVVEILTSSNDETLHLNLLTTDFAAQSDNASTQSRYGVVDFGINESFIGLHTSHFKNQLGHSGQSIDFRLTGSTSYLLLTRDEFNANLSTATLNTDVTIINSPALKIPTHNLVADPLSGVGSIRYNDTSNQLEVFDATWNAVGGSGLDPAADETITGKWDFSTGLTSNVGTANVVSFGTTETINYAPRPTIKVATFENATVDYKNIDLFVADGTTTILANMLHVNSFTAPNDTQSRLQWGIGNTEGPSFLQTYVGLQAGYDKDAAGARTQFLDFRLANSTGSAFFLERNHTTNISTATFDTDVTIINSTSLKIPTHDSVTDPLSGVGSIRYNDTLNQLEVFDTTWNVVGGSGGGSGLDPAANEAITGKWDFSTGLTSNSVTFGTTEAIGGNQIPTIKTATLVNPTSTDTARSLEVIVPLGTITQHVNVLDTNFTNQSNNAFARSQWGVVDVDGPSGIGTLVGIIAAHYKDATGNAGQSIEFNILGDSLLDVSIAPITDITTTTIDTDVTIINSTSLKIPTHNLLADPLSGVGSIRYNNATNELEVFDTTWNTVGGTPYDQSLNTTDDVTFNKVTTTEATTPTLASATNIVLTAPMGVQLLGGGALTLPRLTDVEISALTGMVGGEVVYDTVNNITQIHNGTTWKTLNWT